MFWAAFGFGRRSELVVMKGDPHQGRGGVNAQRYIEVLQEYLLPMVEDGESIFMHDNAPIHTCNAVNAWLDEEVITVYSWPPYSPDLNPIENLWKMLKAEIVRVHPELITMKDNNCTQEHLVKCAKEAWGTLEEQMLDKLASGMQKRVDAVKAAKGWYTKY